MSDQAVRAAIEQMEGWMADPTWELDPELLAQWNAEFQAALALAERTEGWTGLVARAHAVGVIVEARASQVAQLRDGVKAELDTQGRGNRALRGYGAGAV